MIFDFFLVLRSSNVSSSQQQLHDDLENLTLRKSKMNLISAPFVEYLKRHPFFKDYLVSVEFVDNNLIQKVIINQYSEMS